MSQKILVLDKNSNSVHGSSMLSIAKTIPGPSNMEQATARGVSALHERTEKLNMTVEATERLKENAMTLSQRTGKLIEKYERKNGTTSSCFRLEVVPLELIED
ncbi:BMA-TOM-1 [Dirofilaria immitis]|nr:BMA-TOM-1 [Dirofilaria immitis]